MSTSKLLAEIDEREILNPTPRRFAFAGHTFEIVPMPDSKLMRIGDAIGEVASVVSGIVEMLSEGVSPLSLAVHMPAFIRTLIPCSTQIATIALDISAEAAANMPLVDRIELLTIILEVERTPLLLKKWTALMALFQVESPSAQATG